MDYGCQLQKTKEAKEKKYYHNTAMVAVFDGFYGRLYLIAKTTQVEVKGTGMLTYGI